MYGVVSIFGMLFPFPCFTHFLLQQFLHWNCKTNLYSYVNNRNFTYLCVRYSPRVSFVRSMNCSEWQELNSCISSCFSRSNNSAWLCLSSSLFRKNSLITLSASFSAKRKSLCSYFFFVFAKLVHFMYLLKIERKIIPL